MIPKMLTHSLVPYSSFYKESSSALSVRAISLVYIELCKARGCNCTGQQAISIPSDGRVFTAHKAAMKARMGRLYSLKRKCHHRFANGEKERYSCCSTFLYSLKYACTVICATLLASVICALTPIFDSHSRCGTSIVF